MNEELPPLRTQTSKKLVFALSVFVSGFFNVMLFSSLGTTLFVQFIWAMVGLIAVIFQTVQIREYFNIKKKKRYWHLTAYAACTLFSFCATIGLGISQMKGMENNNADQIALVENINSELTTITNGEQKQAMKRRLLSLQNKAAAMTNRNSWLFNVVDKKIDKLTDEIYGTNELSRIAFLKNQRAGILKNQSGITTAIEGLANLFGVTTALMSFIFLFSAAFMLEVMVFSSASFTGKLITLIPFQLSSGNGKPPKKEKQTKIQKEISNGQKVFDDVDKKDGPFPFRLKD